MKNILKFVLFIAAAALFAVNASGQVTSAGIAGKVGQNGEPVPGAPVIAVHTPSGTQFYAVTDLDGEYRINDVIAGGPYTITVEMLGFHKTVIKDVETLLAQTIVVDVNLEEESLSLSEAVVEAIAPDSGASVRRGGTGTTVRAKTISTIPTVGRSLNDVMRLTPQAVGTTAGIAIGGANYRGSAVTVDGAAFNNAFGIGGNLPGGGNPISLDVIDQVSVSVTPFDVRQSGFQGGTINAVTKSGTNRFSASVYNYYTSDKVRGARIGDADVTTTGALKNTTGFTLGGPIVKNKLFFFVNAEYSIDNVPGSQYVARSDASQSWGTGTNVNRPTASQMDAISSFLTDKLGYNPGRYQGYSLETPDYKLLARLDWNINENNRLNFRFSHTHVYGSNSASSSMSPIGGTNSSFAGGTVSFNRYSAGRQSQYAMLFESANYYKEYNFTSAAAELNSRFSDGKGSNVLRLTLSHQREPRSYVGGDFPTVDILSNEEVSGSDKYASYTTFGPDPFSYGNLCEVRTITVTDEFSYVAGRHNILAGAQFESNLIRNGYMQGGAGWYIYKSWDDFVADVTDASASPVAFMITHANLDNPAEQAFPTMRYSQFSIYAQDEVRFSDYFKATFGLRFEMPSLNIPTDNYNKDFARIAAENPASSFAGLSTDNIPALGSSYIEGIWTNGVHMNISPRVGFDWDILKDRTLVLRGGTGLYTGRIPNVWLVSAVLNANCLQYQYIANDKTGLDVVHFSSDRSEIISSIWNGSFKKQDLAAPTSATFLAEDFKMPTSWKSSLGLDARLPFGIKATLEGVYSRNLSEVCVTSLGYAKTGSVKLPGEPESRSVWTSEGIKNSSNATIGGYLIHNVSDNSLRGYYYSLTAQLSKSFPFGLDVSAAYTRSDSRGVNDGGGDQVYEIANSTLTKNGCNEPELGYSSFVSPNRVIANVSYTIDEGPVTATRIGLVYEGCNFAAQGVSDAGVNAYTRTSYLINNQGGANSVSQLIYIPTDSEVDQMPFGTLSSGAWIADDGSMRQAYKDFLASDPYTRKHRGEYSVRGCVVAPWLNRLNLHVAQDFFFNVAGRRQTLEVGVDIENLGNLLNSEWGVYKQLSSNTVLTYQADNTGEKRYTFTAPKWNTYNNLASTWQMLLSARWFF